MKNIEDLGEVISSDVLIIGGGLAGLLASIEARAKGADVLVVDKGGVGPLYDCNVIHHIPCCGRHLLL